MPAEKKLAGYTSIDKPWLKHYTENWARALVPCIAIFTNLYNKITKNRKDDISMIKPEFDTDIYKSHFENSDTKYDTGPLPVWIDTATISEQKIEDIRKSDTAFALFINQLRERENIYQNVMEAASKAKNELEEIKDKSDDRKLAVVMMTIAEIFISIGISGVFSEDSVGYNFVVLAGLIMTGFSLYLNFRKRKKTEESAAFRNNK